MSFLKDFTKEKFDIIIQGGQSNCEGGGFGDVEKPYQPSDKVWYLNQDGTISQATEIVVENRILSLFQLQFARRYIEDGRLEDGRSLLIVRTAIGGTGFCDKRWGLQDDLYLQMMEMTKTALSLNSDNRIAAFLWHQGETDAGPSGFDVHTKNLSNLIKTVRGEFGNMPFLAGDFCQQWKNDNLEICAPVVDAIREVCKQTDNTSFVETDGLNSNSQEYGKEPEGNKDTIHFSRAALYLLGERYYEAFVKLVNE